MVSLLTLLLVSTPILPAVYVYNRLAFFGAFRSTFHSVREYAGSDDYFTIPHTPHAEDLYYHAPSHQIITIAQKEFKHRFGWFPAGGNLDKPQSGQQDRATIWAIDTETWVPREITTEGFDGTFVSHGIDVYISPEDPNDIYLHAVNHPPLLVNGEPQAKSDSRIEIFRVNLTSYSAKHVITLKHPLVHTPNDIFSLGPTDLLVTNDHVNAQGVWRFLEDFQTFSLFSNTNIVRINETDAEIVASGIHDANGLGRGQNNEVLLGDASGGKLSIFHWDGTKLVDRRDLPGQVSIDNPTYYVDPYATPGNNASGYVVGGIANGIRLDVATRDPSVKLAATVSILRETPGGKVEKRLLVEDDGQWVSGASTALLVPIPLEKEKEGRKTAWLVVNGPWTAAIGVMRVDLTRWARI